MQWSKLAMELRSMETSFHAKVNRYVHAALTYPHDDLTDVSQGYRDGTLDQATHGIHANV